MPLGGISHMARSDYRELFVLGLPPQEVTSSVAEEGHRRNHGSRGQRHGPVPPDQPLFHGDYIDVEVDLETFVRTIHPMAYWDHVRGQPRFDILRQRRRQQLEQREVTRQPASCLYTVTCNQQGNVSPSARMSQWLNELPVPEETLCGTQGSSQPQSHHGPEGGHGRPRANSTPVPHSISANHLMATHDHRSCQPSPAVPDGSTIPSFNHPNPLGQHPIALEELPVQLRIPKRQSSLQYSTRKSQLNSPAAHTNTAEDDLIRGIQSIPLGQSVQLQGSQLGTGHWHRDPDLQINNNPTGIARWNTVSGHQLDPHALIRPRNSTPHPNLDCHLGLGHNTLMVDAPPPYSNSTNANVQAQECRDTACRRFSTSVHLLFGEDTGKAPSKKRGRSATPASIEIPRPNKRPRDALGPLDPTRNRMSLFGMPEDSMNVNDGRQSRLRRAASTAVRRISVHLPSGRSIVRVPPFSSQTKYDRITVGFIGDSACGKTSLIQRYSTGYYATENPSREKKDGYSIETYNLEVDNEPIKMDLWDITSQCNYQTAADHCRPLSTGPFSMIAICFDIQDEDTLESAVYKWKNKVEIHSGGPPVILVGLKSDTRKACPTLQLLHLEEPTGTSTGQGEDAARLMSARAYYECSAITGEGVADVFEAVVRIAMERRRSHHNGGAKAKLSMFASKLKVKYQKLRD